MTKLARCLVLILLTTVLLACEDNPDRLSKPEDGTFAPIGTPRVQEAVDGLIVGHRLMAAGEYELALRAYTRAAAEKGFTVDVLSAIGSANLKLGRLGQARKILEAATEKDGTFVPAWNNLGVVLTGLSEFREAERVFRVAFALDSGKSDEIRQNLIRAIANNENSGYDQPQEKEEFELIRRGNGRYLLLQTANSL